MTHERTGKPREPVPQTFSLEEMRDFLGDGWSVEDFNTTGMNDRFVWPDIPKGATIRGLVRKDESGQISSTLFHITHELAPISPLLNTYWLNHRDALSFILQSTYAELVIQDGNGDNLPEEEKYVRLGGENGTLDIAPDGWMRLSGRSILLEPSAKISRQSAQ